MGAGNFNKLRDFKFMNNQFFISYFDRNISNLTHKFDIPLWRLHRGITTFEPWRVKVEFLQAFYAKYGKAAYKEVRAENLEYFIPSGIWSNRTTNGKLLKPSGLAQVDIDDIADRTELERIKNQLRNDQHTALLFESPSGRGLKCLTRIGTSFFPNSMGSYYKEKYNIVIDPAPASNIKGACFVSYDPDAYLSLSAKELILKEEERPIELGKSCVSHSQRAAGEQIADHEQSYLNTVIANKVKAVVDAPQGTGGNTLYRAGLVIGAFNEAGIDTETAEAELKKAFLSRKSKHTEKEFCKIFESAIKKGQGGSQMVIPNRPPESQEEA